MGTRNKNSTYHFTYITTMVGSDKYYVGRHSTNNLNDGYHGSGKWVKSIKDESCLETRILKFFDTFDDLLEGERLLISEKYR